jgi:drug/metabolite transporter (DMT)-like permease
VAVVAWALGSLLHGAVPVQRVLASAAVQMLVGGLVLGLMAIADGDWARLDPAGVSAKSLVAVAYLIVFGSIVAQGCYLWLLGHVAAQKVATYALVNPVVALALGALLLRENLNAWAGLAVLLVLAGVALVLWPAGKPAGGRAHH